MKRIHVVAAIIYDEDGRILISKRPDHVHKGGYWEFPGGKVEENEAEEQALAREIEEELGLHFGQAEFFQRLDYDYGDKQVALSFWQVSNLSNKPEGLVGKEGQQLKWLETSELKQYQFPEANEPIVDALLAVTHQD